MKSLQLAASAAAALLVATSLSTAPAMAQKSKDTLRIAINDPFSTLSNYCVPVDEAGNFYRRIYGTLVQIAEHEKKVVPGLAKSWTRVSPTVLEFDLRDDVTFHNGNKFDADDVVSTLEYAIDPAVKVEFKSRYTWIKKVEKLGPYKVRLEAHTPNATDLGLLGYRTYIQDKESFDTLENKCDYGRLTPYGTAQYKVVSIDKNQGMVVERFEGAKGDPKYVRAPIKRLHAIPVPDKQTQIAQLMTGGVDILRNVQPDNAAELAKNPNLAVSTLPTASFVYIVLDAAGRSGVKPLTDNRVRKAIWMGMNRDATIKGLVPGGAEGIAEKMNMICFDSTIACGRTVDYPPYDPAAAKKLLAEAGYPNGFSLTYSCFIPIKHICEAISNDLLKIGVKAQIEPVTITLFRKKQADGELNMTSIFYPSAGHPDAGNILDVFFVGPRDYAQDMEMAKLVQAGLLEFDDAKRTAIYTKAMDLNNTKNYVMAFSSLPTLYVHSKDIEIKKNLLSAGDNYIDDYFWK